MSTNITYIYLDLEGNHCPDQDTAAIRVRGR